MNINILIKFFKNPTKYGNRCIILKMDNINCVIQKESHPPKERHVETIEKDLQFSKHNRRFQANKP